LGKKVTPDELEIEDAVALKVSLEATGVVFIEPNTGLYCIVPVDRMPRTFAGLVAANSDAAIKKTALSPTSALRVGESQDRSSRVIAA